MVGQPPRTSLQAAGRDRHLRVALLLGLCAAIGAAAYWMGGRQARADLSAVRAALFANEERLAELAEEHRQLRWEASKLQVDAQVDRASMEQLRQTIRGQQKAAAELREEIAFYKGLMAPTERERGLGIRGWELYALPEPRHYRFKLTLQQLAVKHDVLQGHVTVGIAGRQDGNERTLSLYEVAGFDRPELKLRFRYFQNIEGELQLPDGFEPQSVAIVANATRPRQAKAERHFGWLVQGEDAEPAGAL